MAHDYDDGYEDGYQDACDQYKMDYDLSLDIRHKVSSLLDTAQRDPDMYRVLVRHPIWDDLVRLMGENLSVRAMQLFPEGD